MECFEVDNRMISYLDGSLPDQELQAFLKHLDKCEECRHEVELYFTLIEGLHQMDEDEIKIFDFQQAFEKNRKDAKQEIRDYQKYRRIVDYIVLFFVAVIIFFGLLHGFFQIYAVYHTLYCMGGISI